MSFRCVPQQPTTCGQLPSVVDGVFSVSSFEIGAVAYLQCFGNHDVQGQNFTTCQSDGTWSSSSGICSPICNSNPTIENGTVRIDSNLVGSQAEIVCNTSFALEGPDKIYCQYPGEWSPVVSICRPAHPTGCGQLPKLQNCHLSANGNVIGSLASVNCNTGHQLQGEGLITCLPSGIWSPLMATCDVFSCGNVPDIENGIFKANRSSAGSQAELVCNTGYEIQEQTSITCLESGEWSPTTGTCNKTEVADDRGNSALIWAVRGRHFTTVNVLLKRNVTLNTINSEGATALHKAVENGDFNITFGLLEAGADRNISTKSGKTALDISIQLGYGEIARLLFENVGNANQPQCLRCNGTQFLNNAEAVLVAVKTNNHASVDFLLDQCSNPNSLETATNTSALMFAAIGRNVEIVRSLLKCLAYVNFQSTNGSTALMLAAETGNSTIVNELLNAGADPSIRDNSRNTAKFYSVQNGHTSVDQLL